MNARARGIIGYHEERSEHNGGHGNPFVETMGTSVLESFTR